MQFIALLSRFLAVNLRRDPFRRHVGKRLDARGLVDVPFLLRVRGTIDIAVVPDVVIDGAQQDRGADQSNQPATSARKQEGDQRFAFRFAGFAFAFKRASRFSSFNSPCVTAINFCDAGRSKVTSVAC
jgi:hypothetical protein